MAENPTAFTQGPRTENGMTVWEEHMVLPSTGTKLSNAIKQTGFDGGLRPNMKHLNWYASFRLEATAVTGTNLDIALMGGFLEDGSDAVVIVAALVTALTDTTPAAAVRDLNATPYPYYFIRVTVDADESANGLIINAFSAPDS